MLWLVDGGGVYASTGGNSSSIGFTGCAFGNNSISTTGTGRAHTGVAIPLIHYFLGVCMQRTTDLEEARLRVLTAQTVRSRLPAVPW